MNRRELERAVRSKDDLSRADLYGANLREADLRGANLREADLRGANLRRANLYGANLRRANLRGANLYGANLYEANLSRANLYGANLYEADLRGADLYEADLRGANLYGANLYEADLYGANLYGADLYGADLYGANLTDILWDYTTTGIAPAPEGTLIVWGKKSGHIVKMRVDEGVPRSCATTRKFRSASAVVLEIDDGEEDSFNHIARGIIITQYAVGETVFSDSWNDNRWDECSHGIHWFLTRHEAEEWDK